MAEERNVWRKRGGVLWGEDRGVGWRVKKERMRRVRRKRRRGVHVGEGEELKMEVGFGMVEENG